MHLQNIDFSWTSPLLSIVTMYFSDSPMDFFEEIIITAMLFFENPEKSFVLNYI